MKNAKKRIDDNADLYVGFLSNDLSISLYDYRARFYDPLTGSFVQPDSIVPLLLIEMSRRGDGNWLDLWLGKK